MISHIQLRGFPPLRHTVHHYTSENGELPNFYTPLTKPGKLEAGGLSNTDMKRKHLCTLTKQQKSDCVILPITCRKATEPKILATDSPMLLISSSRTCLLSGLVFPADCMLWIGCARSDRNRCKLCAGSAQWFCHSAGLAARVARACTLCVRETLCR